MINQSCYFCGRPLSEKTYRLVVLNHNICSLCECRLTVITAEDKYYEFFKEKIRKLWVS